MTFSQKQTQTLVLAAGAACWLLYFVDASVAAAMSFVFMLAFSRHPKRAKVETAETDVATPDAPLSALPALLERTVSLAYDRKGFSTLIGAQKDVKYLQIGDVSDLFSRYGFLAEDVQKIFFHLLGCIGSQALQWRLIRNDIPREGIPEGHKGAGFQLSIAPRLDSAGKIERFDIHLSEHAQKEPPQTTAATANQPAVDLKNYLEREMVFALIRIPESVFRNFTEETMRLTQVARTEIRKLGTMNGDDRRTATETMFRFVHTIKANARAFKLRDIHDSASNVEKTISSIQQAGEAKPAEIKELLQHFMAMTDAVYAVTDLRRELTEQASPDQSFVTGYRLQWIRSLMRRFSEAFRNPRLNFRDLERILRELDKALSSFDTMSLFEYMQGYDSLLQNLAQQLGKRVGRIVYSGVDAQFKRTVIVKLNDVILHCLRNAMDHGIENVDQRLAAGKKPEGTITITCGSVNGKITLSVSDDGAGIDRARIADKALKIGLITKDALPAMTDEDVYALICRPGFSTKETNNDVSGRGVGMDVVQATMSGLNGRLEFQSRQGLGTTISLTFREDEEKYQPSYKMMDISRSFLQVYDKVSAVLASRSQEVRWPALDRPYFVFAEEHALSALLNNFLFLLLSMVERGSKIDVVFTSFKGKRRMDSHEFYRLTFRVHHADGVEGWIQGDALESLKEYCQPLDAVLRGGPGQALEFNVPSNLPVHYDAIKLSFMLTARFLADCEPIIIDYMKQYMQGFEFEVVGADRVDESMKGVRLWVLAPEESIDTIAGRERLEKMENEDFIIVVPKGQSTIKDTLAGRWGEKLLFLNDQFGKEQFLQSIEAVISRQLAARMMQDKVSIQPVLKTA